MSENQVRKSDLYDDPKSSDDLHDSQVMGDTSPKTGQKPSRARRKGAPDDIHNILYKSTRDTADETPLDVKCTNPERASTVETTILRAVKHVRRDARPSISTKSQSSARSSFGSLRST